MRKYAHAHAHAHAHALFDAWGSCGLCLCKCWEAKDVDPGLDAQLEFFRSYLDEFHQVRGGLEVWSWVR